MRRLRLGLMVVRRLAMRSRWLLEFNSTLWERRNGWANFLVLGIARDTGCCRRARRCHRRRSCSCRLCGALQLRLRTSSSLLLHGQKFRAEPILPRWCRSVAMDLRHLARCGILQIHERLPQHLRLQNVARFDGLSLIQTSLGWFAPCSRGGQVALCLRPSPDAPSDRSAWGRLLFAEVPHRGAL